MYVCSVIVSFVNQRMQRHSEIGRFLCLRRSARNLLCRNRSVAPDHGLDIVPVLAPCRSHPAFELVEADFCLGCEEVGLMNPHRCCKPGSPYAGPVTLTSPSSVNYTFPKEDDLFKTVFTMVNRNDDYSVLVKYMMSNKFRRVVRNAFNRDMIRAYNLDPDTFINFSATWNGLHTTKQCQAAVPVVVSLFRDSWRVECIQQSSIRNEYDDHNDHTTEVRLKRYATLVRACTRCVCATEKWRDRECTCECHGLGAANDISHPGSLVYKPVTFLTSHCTMPCTNMVVRHDDGRSIPCGNFAYFMFRSIPLVTHDGIEVETIDPYADSNVRSNRSCVPVGTPMVRVCGMWDCSNEILCHVVQDLDILNCPNCPFTRNTGIDCTLLPLASPGIAAAASSSASMNSITVTNSTICVHGYQPHDSLSNGWLRLLDITRPGSAPAAAASQSMVDMMTVILLGHPVPNVFKDKTIGRLWSALHSQFYESSMSVALVPYHIYQLISIGRSLTHSCSPCMTIEACTSLENKVLMIWQRGERCHYRQLVKLVLAETRKQSLLDPFLFDRLMFTKDRPHLQIRGVEYADATVPRLSTKQLFNMGIGEIALVYGTRNIGQLSSSSSSSSSSLVYGDEPGEQRVSKTLEFIECGRCGYQSSMRPVGAILSEEKRDDLDEIDDPEQMMDKEDGLDELCIGSTGGGGSIVSALKHYRAKEKDERTKIGNQTRIKYRIETARHKTVKRIKIQVLAYMYSFTLWYDVNGVKQQQSVEWINRVIDDVMEPWSVLAIPDCVADEDGMAIRPIIQQERIYHIACYLAYFMCQHKDVFPGLEMCMRVQNIEKGEIRRKAMRERKRLNKLKPLPAPPPPPESLYLGPQPPTVCISPCPPLYTPPHHVFIPSRGHSRVPSPSAPPPPPTIVSFLPVDSFRFGNFVGCVRLYWRSQICVLPHFHLTDPSNWARDIVWQFALLDRSNLSRNVSMRVMSCAVLCMLAFMRRFHAHSVSELRAAMKGSDKVRVFDSSTKMDRHKMSMIAQLFQIWHTDSSSSSSCSSSSVAALSSYRVKSPVKQAKQLIKDVILQAEDDGDNDNSALVLLTVSATKNTPSPHPDDIKRFTAIFDQ